MRAFLFFLPLLLAIPALTAPTSELGLCTPDPSPRALPLPPPSPNKFRSLSLPISRRSDSRTYHPNVEVRHAARRDESIRLRTRYADLLDQEERAVLQRDVEEVRNSLKRGPIELFSYMWDTEYLAKISVGTPSQDFFVIPDTGSADIFLFDSECGEWCPQTVFQRNRSTTFSSTEYRVADSFLSGYITAGVGTDTVGVGENVLSDQSLLLIGSGDITQVLRKPVSGVLGLAFGDLSLVKDIAPDLAAPFWSKMGHQFGIHLGRHDEDAGSRPQGSYYGPADTIAHVDTNSGELTLGGVNPALYTGVINYVPSSHKYWTAPLQVLVVGGQTVALPTGADKKQTLDVIIDTGTTGLSLPPQVIYAIRDHIPGSQVMDNFLGIPCDTNVEFSLTFGGVQYPFHARHLLAGKLPEQPGLCDSTLTQSSVSIVGAAFLKNYYTAFRMDPPSVGFASLAR